MIIPMEDLPIKMLDERATRPLDLDTEEFDESFYISQEDALAAYLSSNSYTDHHLSPRLIENHYQSLPASHQQKFDRIMQPTYRMRVIEKSAKYRLYKMLCHRIAVTAGLHPYNFGALQPPYPLAYIDTYAAYDPADKGQMTLEAFCNAYEFVYDTKTFVEFGKKEAVQGWNVLYSNESRRTADALICLCANIPHKDTPHAQWRYYIAVAYAPPAFLEKYGAPAALYPPTPVKPAQKKEEE